MDIVCTIFTPSIYKMSMICIDSDTESYVDCPTTNYCSVNVNGIDHWHYSFVNVSVPSEISRDYSWDDVSFSVAVSWYNVDASYVEDIIAVQSYKPTASDFQTLVSEWLPRFWVLLFVCLFVILIFYMIKKIF